MAPVTPHAAIEAAPPTASSSLSARIASWRPWIAQAAARFSIPQAWIEVVMAAESGGRTHLNGAPITSRAGAMGLMQLMPETYAQMARLHGLGSDPHDPRDNILAGAAYLSAMRERFGYPGLFGAYNAGPARFEAHLRTGAALPSETQAYIRALARTPPSPDLPPAVLSGARLFFPLDPGAVTVHPGVAPAPSGGLFAPPGRRAGEGEEDG